MIFSEQKLNELQTLLGGVAEWQTVAPKDLPEPYQGLLAHNRHMTVTLESYWNSPVSVHVLYSDQESQRYARQIYLTEQTSDRTIEYGAVILDLDACSDEVREEILAMEAPLGRILTRHNILTEIDCHEFARIHPGAAMCGAFDLDPSDVLYGRFATISFNDKPAMALIEVMPTNLEIRE